MNYFYCGGSFAVLEFNVNEFNEDVNSALSYSMENQEWEGYDGWYNNPAHPDWGGAGNVVAS